MFFSILAGCPRTSPKWPFQLDFSQVWSICCRFGSGGHFQHPGRVPSNPPKLAFINY